MELGASQVLVVVSTGAGDIEGKRRSWEIAAGIHMEGGDCRDFVSTCALSLPRLTQLSPTPHCGL